MRIEFLQSGGVAGVRRPPLIVDTASLPGEEAQHWQDLVAAADFFNLSPTSTSSSRRDAFTCRITVEADGRLHTVQTHPGAVSAAVDTLVEHLRQFGLHRRGE